MATDAAPKQPKKIAIIGFTASRELAPWDDQAWEKWLCNNLWCHTESDDWQRIYDLHEGADIVKDRVHDAFLRGQTQKRANGTTVALKDRPAYVYESRKEWPTSVEFPKEEIIERFGDYQTNSISLMIGHAIMEGATHIGVYGVDMATGSEYAAQRPSCEWMLGIAKGMGIEIDIPLQSDLLKTPGIYGTGADTALHAKMIERRTELSSRLQALNNQQAQIQGQAAQIQGALETTNYIIDVWTHPRASRDGQAKDIAQFAEDAVKVEG